MTVELCRAGEQDARLLWEMQVEAFRALYAKYQYTETSPAAEPLQKTITRLQQPATYYYFIREKGVEVGAIRVVDTQEPGTPKRISPLFILPRYRNRGLAQKAIRAVEELHGASNWELATILQEAGNCHLYEKMGYRQTGKLVPVNDKLTLVIYRK
ncbi:MAG: GNAT family N-acetyltransferase [Clostridiales bacterium]|nr:GNAT family N-acetyltransferase [Clostridiales bacterium]